MDISTAINITGTASKNSYSTDTAVRHEAKVTVPEMGATPIDELTPEHVETLRERMTAALKDAGRRVNADLDVVLEHAEARAAAARKKAREEQPAFASEL